MLFFQKENVVTFYILTKVFLVFDVRLRVKTIFEIPDL